MTHFRGLAARCIYLSQDRRDWEFSAKEIRRFMSDPTKVGVEALKRLGRYLVKRRRLVFHYPWQENVECMEVYADTDPAGCLRARKSASGGCVLLGAHLLKAWSSTQPTTTLPSGEAELHGVVRGSAAGLGVLSLLADFEA